MSTRPTTDFVVLKAGYAALMERLRENDRRWRKTWPRGAARVAVRFKPRELCIRCGDCLWNAWDTHYCDARGEA